MLIPFSKSITLGRIRDFLFDRGEISPDVTDPHEILDAFGDHIEELTGLDAIAYEDVDVTS